MNPIGRRTLSSLSSLGALCAVIALATPAQASHQSDPPFDFTDAFYLQNGIDPTKILGRPVGLPPNSVIDHVTPHGPQFNDVRLLQQTAAFDDSGHPIFFSVTGVLPSNLTPFTNNAAGQEAFQTAEEFKVYEFPRAANAPFAVFPKRQDLMADLSGGYFSNDPLGLWQINTVRYTPAALNSPAGQQALAQLAAQNGVDLDGTPVIRTKSELFNLQSQGFVVIATPPIGGPDLRWFICPVIKDPRGGAIAADAHLEIIKLANGFPLPAEQENFDLFHCLQETGDECVGGGFSGAISTFGFGTAQTCPCGNASGAQVGCINSTGLGGRLAASGTARVTSDSVVLLGSQMPNTPTLYFQGTAATSGVFGDGLRVAGGTVLRLGTRVNVNGASSFPAQGGPALSSFGVLPGDTRYYQAWFRDNATFCTSDKFNLTNGVRITWGL